MIYKLHLPVKPYPVRTLLVTFEMGDVFFPISAFRGAVVSKVGRDHPLFHNHEGDGSSIYRYPLIQYKYFLGKPAIFCIGDGVDEIHHLFLQNRWELDIQGRKVGMKVDRLDLRTVPVQLNGQLHAYRLNEWQGLNDANYRLYRGCKDSGQQQSLLERILRGNLLSFAKGIGWHVDGEIIVAIPERPTVRSKGFKGVSIDVFEMVFLTNLLLPEGVGLGKAVSQGFGVLERMEPRPV